MNKTLAIINILSQMKRIREQSIHGATLDLIWNISPLDMDFPIGDIFLDNRETDREIIQHFLEILPEGHEIHLKRCEESGIVQCVCFEKIGASKRLQEVLL